MKVLAFFAHPDDETMLGGGVLALLRRLGAEIHYLCATRGEGGEAGEPPLCERSDLGALRATELACAVEALGGGDLELLDYIDPSVGPDNTLYAFTDDLDRLALQVVESAQRTGAFAMLTHGSNGEYGHPAHIAAHRAALLAANLLEEQGRPLLLYTWQAAFAGHPKEHIMNRDDLADLVLDITPVLEAKTLATLCHRSQNALFVRNASRRAGRQLSVPEIVVRLESLHRVRPGNGRPVQDALAGLLRQSGCVQECKV